MRAMSVITKSCLPIAAAGALVAAPAMIMAQDDPAKLVQARLLAPVSAAAAGTTVTVGLELTVAPDWHIYWTNPGESGMPTSAKWKINGTAVDTTTRYPVPHTFESPGPTISYGYEKNAVLLTDLFVPKDATKLDLQVSARYLACSDRCIPGKAEVSLSIPVKDKAEAGPDAELINKAEALIPKPGLPEGVEVNTNALDGKLRLVWTPKAGTVLAKAEKEGERALELYPDAVPGILWKVPALEAGKPTTRVYDKGASILIEYRNGDAKKSAGQPLRGVLVFQRVDADGKTQPVEARSFTINQ